MACWGPAAEALHTPHVHKISSMQKGYVHQSQMYTVRVPGCELDSGRLTCTAANADIASYLTPHGLNTSPWQFVEPMVDAGFLWPQHSAAYHQLSTLIVRRAKKT